MALYSLQSLGLERPSLLDAPFGSFPSLRPLPFGLVLFELAQFLKDPAIEKQALDGALASGDVKLIALAQDWLRDTGQAVPVASRIVSTSQAAEPAEAPKPTRYLRGVR